MPRAWLGCLALIGGLQVLPAAAQETPDYVGFGVMMERFAFATASGASCRNFGYAPDQDGLLAYGQQLIDDAVLGGMPEATANLLATGLIEDEARRQEARTREVAARQSDSEAVDRFLDYWQARCESLEVDPAYAPFFQRQLGIDRNAQ